MGFRYAFSPLQTAAVVALLAGSVASAQTFGSPEEEQRRLAQMSSDVARIERTEEQLVRVQRKRMLEIGPAEKAPRKVLERWRKEDVALTTYIELFRDLHGASVVLINAVSISLRVEDRFLPPLHIRSICMYMPGKAILLTTKKAQGDRSLPRRWSFLAHEVLNAPELTQVLEGLETADRLADAYNGLCDRATKIENWKP